MLLYFLSRGIVVTGNMISCDVGGLGGTSQSEAAAKPSSSHMESIVNLMQLKTYVFNICTWKCLHPYKTMRCLFGLKGSDEIRIHLRKLS